MENEIRRRIGVLDNIRIPVTTKRDLRGGMQKKVHRQEIKRFSNNIESAKTKLKNKLKLIEQQEEREIDKTFRAFSEPVMLDDFDEPFFRKIRSKRGFY